MGYLEIIPKSHLKGALKQKDNTLLHNETFDEKDFIKIKMNKGDVLFFSTFLIHKSGNNTSEKIRLTTHIRYDDAKEKSFIKRKYPHHRIDKRADGILFPDLNTKKIIKNIFK
jgi:ectoine hydroxylase-related dioxygenase (phytanoyl-CoA dioxygenase family)